MYGDGISEKCNWSEWTVETNDIFADYELNYNDNFGDIYTKTLKIK